jgi:hypothetical protein
MAWAGQDILRQFGKKTKIEGLRPGVFIEAPLRSCLLRRLFTARQATERAALLLQGRIRGRVVVNTNA